MEFCFACADYSLPYYNTTVADASAKKSLIELAPVAPINKILENGSTRSNQTTSHTGSFDFRYGNSVIVNDFRKHGSNPSPFNIQYGTPPSEYGHSLQYGPPPSEHVYDLPVMKYNNSHVQSGYIVPRAFPSSNASDFSGSSKLSMDKTVESSSHGSYSSDSSAGR